MLSSDSLVWFRGGIIRIRILFINRYWNRDRRKTKNERQVFIMICYTCITNGYDNLKDPVVTEGWEYICYSDVQQKSDIWDCRITDKPQRELKILGYKESGNVPALYIDGSIEVTGNLDRLMSAIKPQFSIWRHPVRDCIFEEAKAVIRHKGLDEDIVNKQMERYKDMPHHWGLGQTGIMFRDFSLDWVRGLSDSWWSEVSTGLDRDQLSLTYVCWNMGKRPHFIPTQIIGQHFKLHLHNKNLWRYE